MRFSLFFISILLTVQSFATETEEHYNELFSKANVAYKQGAYDSAKSIYNEIAQNGMVSTKLFYNLGNCHYKLGNIPASILNYERALKLNPSDEDALYNLSIANAQITDRIEPIGSWFLAEWWKASSLALNPDTWAMVSFIMLIVTLLLITAFVVGKEANLRKVGLLGGIVSFGLYLLVFSLGQTSKSWKNKTEAIVFAPTVDVKSEPTTKSTDQFVLHEGIKVQVIGEDADWVRIKLSDGNSGWIQRRSIETI